MKKWIVKARRLGEGGDVPGWVLITLMTAALVDGQKYDEQPEDRGQ